MLYYILLFLAGALIFFTLGVLVCNKIWESDLKKKAETYTRFRINNKLYNILFDKEL